MTNLPRPATPAAMSIAVGHSAKWQKAGYPDFEPQVPHAFATTEIVGVPRLTDLKLPAGTTAWQAMRASAMSMLADGALMAGCDSFEIRYLVSPRDLGGPTVRMLLTAKVKNGVSASTAQTAVLSACHKLPAGFTWSAPAAPVPYGLANESEFGDSIVELRRLEQVTFPQWDYVPSEYYYSIDDTTGDGSGWPAFWRTLSSVDYPASVSLLFANTYLDPFERDTLGQVVTSLYRLSEERTDYDILYNPVIYPACMNAKRALESWERRLDQLQRPLLGRAAVRSTHFDTAIAVATALATAAAVSGESLAVHPMAYEVPVQPSDYRQADFSYHWMEHLPWGGHVMWEEDSAPVSLRRLPYLYGLNEAASLLVLPIPDEQGVPGMATARSVAAHREQVSLAETDREAVRLGQVLHQGLGGSAADLPLAALNRHTLVVGSPGSGKTTTVMSLLAELWREHRIPFLVIESVKTEYRSLADVTGMEELQVLTLGNEGIAPLRMNPLTPPPGIRCEVHQSSVMAALKLALPLFPPQPQILAKALARTFERAGWDDDSTSADGLLPPTLRDLQRHYRDVFDEIGYIGEARNIGLAFDTRLESLLQGSRGRLLDTIQSSDFDDLLSKPVVLELNDINDTDERSVLAAFILDRVRASAKRRSQVGGTLRHVTVLEEAHRLLARSFAGGGDAASGDQARSDSVRAFCEAIAELRSLGEGFVLSTQTPSALAQAAISNAGVRIIHRLESGEDRRTMMDDMGATEGIREIAARLRQGEAIVRWPELDEPEVVAVHAAVGIDSSRFVPDELVAERMRSYRHSVGRLLPYALCSPEVCQNGCEGKVRRTGAAVADAVKSKLRTSSSGAGSVSIADLLASEGVDEQATYCGAAQLSAQGAAFPSRSGLDGRPIVIAAVRRALGRRGGGTI